MCVGRSAASALDWIMHEVDRQNGMIASGCPRYGQFLSFDRGD
ncbi:hypothetical protein MPC4_70159 [Methylocella tundrae]|uniref:Uncharacterized protein n=1 Tax=Methylocella tundrae TaxID=227605 RepID=A0A8B6MC49_METTU|nr:hypothetical protein MPC1_510006 [Methylocella tundrae]VTZ52271.1 hypothetical protein MPC4_70159 [Methylocella tundrae]